MCMRVTCPGCQLPTWGGCGRHIEQVLAGVPRDQRCKCPRAAGAVRPAGILDLSTIPHDSRDDAMTIRAITDVTSWSEQGAALLSALGSSCDNWNANSMPAKLARVSGRIRPSSGGGFVLNLEPATFFSWWSASATPYIVQSIVDGINQYCATRAQPPAERFREPTAIDIERFLSAYGGCSKWASVTPGVKTSAAAGWQGQHFASTFLARVNAYCLRMAVQAEQRPVQAPGVRPIPRRAGEASDPTADSVGSFAQFVITVGLAYGLYRWLAAKPEPEMVTTYKWEGSEASKWAPPGWPTPAVSGSWPAASAPAPTVTPAAKPVHAKGRAFRDRHGSRRSVLDKSLVGA